MLVELYVIGLPRVITDGLVFDIPDVGELIIVEPPVIFFYLNCVWGSK